MGKATLHSHKEKMTVKCISGQVGVFFMQSRKNALNASKNWFQVNFIWFLKHLSLIVFKNQTMA
jgi:hypothetical protein